ncbi:deleted in malignant brain tumors 1 protein-like [Haliotis rubra]|uniref:deleted in malignant brain tumors 1 protein-like n=1 Tax=Haliotis rubra TaxID=36100 RepID=UPI001EE5E483|nr:deleted in malignant brain tumors 1 protein-like [Haliotis rubra]
MMGMFLNLACCLLLTATIAEAQSCGENLVASSTSKNATSPGYPASYPSTTNCVWTISAANQESKVRVTFLEVEIPDGYDVVKVYDGNSTSGYLMGQVSGTDKPTFTGQETSLTMELTATANATRPSTKVGFVFGYAETQDTLPMQRSVDAQSDKAVLMSPRFPSGRVKDMNAIWSVRPKLFNKQVLLSFVEVDLGDNCNNNFIKVYQGNTSAVEVSKLCGKQTDTFFSKHSELSVVFRTDSNLARRGFKADYTMVGFSYFPGCYGSPNEVRVFENVNGELESPLYPNKYPNSMKCRTLLKAVLTDIYIKVEVTDINMPQSEGCTKDYVEIFDGTTSTSPNLGRVCGQTKLTVTSKTAGQDVMVTFVSDSNEGGKGYKIKYVGVKMNGQATKSSPVGLIVGIIVGCIGFYW